MTAVPNGTRTLVLNANMMPIDMIPWIESFKRIYKDTECVDCQGKRVLGGERCGRCNGTGLCPSAEVVEYYDVSLKDGKGKKHFVPAVIRNARQVNQSYRKVNYSRQNVLKRDNYTCQYCGAKGGPHQKGDNVILEMEHVVPRSRWNGSGSPTCFSNIVTSCRKCNRKKEDFFLAHTNDHAVDSQLHIYMPLRREINGVMVEYKKPKAPRETEFHLSMDFRNMKKIPTEWVPYIEHLLQGQKRG